MDTPHDNEPLLQHKDYAAQSVFTPENLLREARRQKGLPLGAVPQICILDPDGDLVHYLVDTGQAQKDPTWACYHTCLYTFDHAGTTFGIIGTAVGAAFAVLVAEEVFVAGCQLLISITSAGRITSVGVPPYFVLIERALRDEGTSYHYLPPARYSHLRPHLLTLLRDAFAALPIAVHTGATWTTDAPFRETPTAIAAAEAEGILAVEMEAAALYAFAAARQRDVICFAHVTNQMATIEGDFEKGVAQGSLATLDVISHTAHCWARQAAAK